MSGMKLRRAMWAKLDQHGEARIFEELMTGNLKVKQLCDVMEMSENMFYYWIKQDPERQRVYREMRAAMADGLVDEAMIIADESTAATLGQDRERIKIRTWLAERWDRATYGAPSAAPAGVTLNVGELHLTALKQGPLTDEDQPVAALPSGGEIVVETATEEASGGS